ncbi:MULTISPECIES: hypothetical protein [unclassified Rhizobium]|uniref:hypothetical protein n=1 Tax=unclassified Rhizobium TaxID=2613769 RepID=UPI0011324E9A|nr:MULTISPECIES: hypothetical protein [unclassified Rhizobium]
MTRRHGKDNDGAAITDTSETPIANDTRVPAPLQPRAASSPAADAARDAADPSNLHSNTSDDGSDLAKVVEEPVGANKIDDLAPTTGLGLQPEPVSVSEATRSRKARALRKRDASTEIQSATPSTAPAVSNDFLTLDDEIRQLRSQLAKKVQLQNDQLRKMLERFER